MTGKPTSHIRSTRLPRALLPRWLVTWTRWDLTRPPHEPRVLVDVVWSIDPAWMADPSSVTEARRMALFATGRAETEISVVREERIR